MVRGDCIDIKEIDEVAHLVDAQSARLLWYVWGQRHASLDELRRLLGNASHAEVLSKIINVINPKARHIMERPILVYERSAVDYYTGDHVFYSWWLNEEATGVYRPHAGNGSAQARLWPGP
ncbi:MAG: hypothetical protein SV910_03465 [Chloroflexota bacterium]|nr:hypothetical protein [Chloroflexota bacterium]